MFIVLLLMAKEMKGKEIKNNKDRDRDMGILRETLSCSDESRMPWNQEVKPVKKVIKQWEPR